MPGLRKIVNNYLGIEWIFKVGILSRFSFEDIPFCWLNEKEGNRKLSLMEFFVSSSQPRFLNFFLQREKAIWNLGPHDLARVGNCSVLPWVGPEESLKLWALVI